MGCIILELSLNFKYKYFTCGLVSDTYKPTAVFDLLLQDTRGRCTPQK